jgi:CubicO group peptidase (beta-lactamase class C family)
MAVVQAYQGVTGAEHQASFDKLSALGYRLISLSVYGDPGEAQYAAVWIQRSGPAWVAVHGVDGAGYQAFFNAHTAQGYAPILVSATGGSSNAIFAAVFEQGVAGAWVARHGMTAGLPTQVGTFQYQNKAAADARMMLRSMAIYGTASDRRYAAIWQANPNYVKWHAHAADVAADYQTTFDAETQLPGYRLAGYRPAYVTLSSDHNYCSVFKDDVVGTWVARHGLSAADYQKEFDIQTAQGFYPICVQGGGAGPDTRYAAIFAKQDMPAARQWSVDGKAMPALASLDQTIQAFMKENGVRAAQLTVGKNGAIRFARAYTWAEGGYRTTRVTDRFLLASCSKMFLAAAVQSLYGAGTLKPNTAVYPLLGFSNPADPRSDAITMQQLLDHTAGYDDSSTGSGFDPTYNMRAIALALGLAQPVTKLEVAKYMYGRPLDFAPGAKSQYSNFGYLLAGAVVERVTGTPYFTYVRQTLLQPAEITQVRVFATRAAGRTDDEAIAEDQGLGPSPLDLMSPLLVPYVYGGDGEINEVGAPNDGTGASATALVRFIHLHAVWGNGARAPGARAGSTPGASSWAQSRGDDVDWAYVINTRDFPPATTQTLDGLQMAINQILDGASL